MEIKGEELSKAGEPTVVGAGEEVREELDPIDIEILLTSGHYDDCCIS